MPEAIRAKITAVERAVGAALPPTDEDVARALRGENGWRTYPHPDGKAWTAATTRSARHAIRLERFELLRRLNAVLSVVVGAPDGISRSDAVQLARQEGMDLYWLYERFENRDFFPDGPGAAALVSFDETKFRISATDWARGVTKAWAAVKDYDPVMLDVARAVLFAGTSPVENLEVICRRFHVPSFDLVNSALFAQSPAGMRLSSRGQEAARMWDFHLAGWDHNYWPVGGEEEAMPANWDWDQRPFHPRDLVTLAIGRLLNRTTPKVRSLLRDIAAAGTEGLAVKVRASIVERLKNDLNTVYAKTWNIPELVIAVQDGDQLVLRPYQYLGRFLPEK